MARKFRQAGSQMTKALGRMIGLLLSLYVFDQIVDTLYDAGLNTSTYFQTAVDFIDNLLPIVGILGAFEIIYSALKASKLL